MTIFTIYPDIEKYCFVDCGEDDCECKSRIGLNIRYEGTTMKTPIEIAEVCGAKIKWPYESKVYQSCPIIELSEAQLKATIDAYNAQFSEPKEGSWISADDYYRNCKELDIALNGTSAERPLLIDILSQVQAAARKHGKPILNGSEVNQSLPPEWAEYINQLETKIMSVHNSGDNGQNLEEIVNIMLDFHL